MSNITIKEITEVVAVSAGITKKSAEAALEAAFATISETLKAGGEVTVRDFGRFFPKVKPARLARNPKTGAAVQVEEKTVFKFTPRGALKA